MHRRRKVRELRRPREVRHHWIGNCRFAPKIRKDGYKTLLEMRATEDEAGELWNRADGAQLCPALWFLYILQSKICNRHMAEPMFSQGRLREEGCLGQRYLGTLSPTRNSAREN